MTGITPPNAERERVFQELKSKAKAYYDVLAEKYPDDSPFDLGCFAAFTLLKLSPLFDPQVANLIKVIVRDFVTLKLDMEKKPENMDENTHMATKPLLYGPNGERNYHDPSRNLPL